MHSYCTHNPTCYYKQLKAKEHEYETLKNTVQIFGSTLNSVSKVCIELAQLFNPKIPDDWENEEIIPDLAEAIKKILSQNQKYKEALEDIADTFMGCWLIPHNCEKCGACP